MVHPPLEESDLLVEPGLLLGAGIGASGLRERWVGIGHAWAPLGASMIGDRNGVSRRGTAKLDARIVSIAKEKSHARPAPLRTDQPLGRGGPAGQWPDGHAPLGR